MNAKAIPTPSMGEKFPEDASPTRAPLTWISAWSRNGWRLVP